MLPSIGPRGLGGAWPQFNHLCPIVILIMICVKFSNSVVFACGQIAYASYFRSINSSKTLYECLEVERSDGGHRHGRRKCGCLGTVFAGIWGVNLWTKAGNWQSHVTPLRISSYWRISTVTYLIKPCTSWRLLQCWGSCAGGRDCHTVRSSPPRVMKGSRSPSSPSPCSWGAHSGSWSSDFLRNDQVFWSRSDLNS